MSWYVLSTTTRDCLFPSARRLVMPANIGEIQGRYMGDTGETACSPRRAAWPCLPAREIPRPHSYLAYISPTSRLQLPYISPNQAIAYLMYANGWGYERAYAFVRERRGIASPNAGFIARLGLGLGLGSG